MCLMCRLPLQSYTVCFCFCHNSFSVCIWSLVCCPIVFTCSLFTSWLAYLLYLPPAVLLSHYTILLSKHGFPYSSWFLMVIDYLHLMLCACVVTLHYGHLIGYLWIYWVTQHTGKPTIQQVRILCSSLQFIIPSPQTEIHTELHIGCLPTNESVLA